MKYHFLILLLSAWLPAIAQNLIANGGFEDTDTLCQNTSAILASPSARFGYEPIGCISPWGNYSNTQLVFRTGGYMHSGNSAASVLLYKPKSDGATFSRSYLIAPTLNPLIKGHTYRISFYYRLWSPCRYTAKALSVAFASELQTGYNDYIPLYLPTVFTVSMFPADTGWQIASFTYTASGTEHYFLMGNFKPIGKTRIKKYNPHKTVAEIHCIVDDIFIDDITPSSVSAVVNIEQSPSTKTNLVLNGNLIALHNFKGHIHFTQTGQMVYVNDTSMFYPETNSAANPVNIAEWNSCHADSSGYPNGGFRVYDSVTHTYKNALLVHCGTLQPNGYYHIHNAVGKLCRPLQKDSLYKLTIFCTGKSNTTKFPNTIEAAFANTCVYSEMFLNQESESYPTPDYVNRSSFTIKSFNNLSKPDTLVSLFKATGSEKFVYIGNLTASKNTKHNYTKKDEKPSVYVVGAMVEPLYETAPCNAPTMEKVDSSSNTTSVSLNDTVYLSSLLFELNSHRLTSECKEVLNNMMSTLKFDPQASVTIIGYTDTTGEYDYNRLLSLKRAEAVRDYLLLKGLPLNQTTVIAGGESVEFAKNQNNRFVKLIIDRNENKQNHTITIGRYADSYTK